MSAQPYPETIEAGLAPEGIVARTYSLDGDLLHEDRVGPMDDVGARADAAAEKGVVEVERSGGVVLAFYDGDDGSLMSVAFGMEADRLH